MKKTTINRILMSIIAFLSVSICFLIFCIATRPRYVIVNEPEAVVITESPTLADDTPAQPETVTAETPEMAPEAAAPDGTMHGKTSTRVNIRDAASADARVLETVEAGTTFDILEIQDNGWTKIQYEELEAYISSDYVIITNG